MDPAALKSLNHTTDRYSMSNQCPQALTHGPRTDLYPVFSSLRTTDKKRKGLRVSFAFVDKNHLMDGKVQETIPTVEALSDLWKPGAMDGVALFLMNCSFILSVDKCFSCLISFVCGCNLCCSLKIQLFVCFLNYVE